MKNNPFSLMPMPVARMLKKFGADIRIAHLKRGFTSKSMAKRSDDTGLLLNLEQLPKRIRPKKNREGKKKCGDA